MSTTPEVSSTPEVEPPATSARQLVPGDRFPDLVLPDSDRHSRRLSDLAGGDPVLLHTYRGWWCPKERQFLRQLVALQEQAEVAYTRFVSLSTDPPEVNAGFRAGLDARWPFLSDADRTALQRLGLRETTDTVHDPYLPTVWLLHPDLTVHRWWLGYWYWARPSLTELHVGLREITAALRPDWDPPLPEPGLLSAWLALLDAPVGDLSAAAGNRVLTGWLDTARRPHPDARRVDPQVLDPDGDPAHLSLLWPDRDALPLFDDPAVVHARRAARWLPTPRAVSTLTVDSQHFAGSLWVVDHPSRLADDPFRPLGRAVHLAVAGGLLGRSRPLVGPGQERYAGAPWPAGAFLGARRPPGLPR